jgi:hypothetical protein
MLCSPPRWGTHCCSRGAQPAESSETRRHVRRQRPSGDLLLASWSSGSPAAGVADEAIGARDLQQTGPSSSTFTTFSPTSILVVRMGDMNYNASSAATGVAMPVYIDEYSVSAVSRESPCPVF